MGLPIVKPEIGVSIQSALLEGAEDKYLEDMVRRLSSQNPAVLKFILTFSKTTGDPRGAVFCGLLVYRLLEVQQEADELTASLGK